MSKKNSCPYCGPSQINHFIAWFSAWVDHSFSIFSSKPNFLLSWLEPLIPNKFYEIGSLGIINTLTFLHLGTIKRKPDERDSYRGRVLWEEAEKRGIEMYEFLLFGTRKDFFVAKYGGVVRCFDGLPRPRGKESDALNWMDNKAILHKKLSAHGIPMAKFGVASTWSQAQKIFKNLKAPVISKPHLGSRSRHTTTHITDEIILKKAFYIARQLSPWVIIEEELSGMVYRGTVIGGKLIGVVERSPASVTGDGIHTLRELVDEENKNPLRQGPIFHHIPENSDTIEELSRQGIDWKTIPEKNKIITLGQKASRGLGGGITNVTHIMHSDNVAILENVGKVLADPLIGIDFIMDDVTRSWKEEPRSGVIEVNSLPFIDLHHYPLVGKPENVAGALWDIVFPESAKGKI